MSKILIDRSTMQQALEALEGWDNYGKWVWPESALEQAKRNTTESLAALRAALAEPPVDDPHRDHWVAIAEAAQKIAASTECGLAEAKALCTALDRLTEAALAQPFSPEAISTTQTAWKMGYEARKAEEQAEPDSPERRCGGPGCDMTCCQPVQDERTTIADLRCAKWLDPECADKGACQSLKFKRSAEPVQEPVCRDDGMPTSAEERHLRRLLALRAAMPHAYYDDGEAQGIEHGISIDFMREPVAHIDAKLRALNVARAIAKQSEPVQEPVACRYPDCVDNGPEGKCTRWLVGECDGPKIGGQP